MSRSLDFFELGYDDQLVVAGEELYDMGGVSEVSKVDRHLYTAIIREGSFSHEVEVLKPKLKSRVTTCDCRQYQTSGTCRHIVAALYAVRKYVQSEEQVERSPQVNSKRMTVASILEQVDHEQLVQFAKGYAKRDKGFATLLKAHFARQVTGHSTVQKYKAILGTVIKPIQTAEVRISASQVRLYAYACEELVDQLEDAIVLEDYTEAIEIWKACVEKNEYVFRYTDLQGKSIDQLALRLSQAAKDLLTASMARRLSDRIMQVIFDVGRLSYYRYRSVLYNPLELLLRHGKMTADWQDKVIDATEQLLSDKSDEGERAIILAIHTRLAIARGDTVDLLIIMQHAGGNLHRYIRYMLQANDYAAARVVSELVVGEGQSLPIINKTLIEIYQYQGDHRKLRQLAYDAFLDSHELRYFDLLKQHTKVEKWYRVRTEVLQQIDIAPVRTEALKRDQDWAALVEELATIGELDLAVKYTSHLKVYEPDMLATLYVGLIKKFLESHIGTMANQTVRDVLIHLEREGAVPSTKAVIKMLDRDFSHRSRLGQV